MANALIGGELVSWKTTINIIRENLYYGFKRDMGAARSTLYKSIGYVARELLKSMANVHYYVMLVLQETLKINKHLTDLLSNMSINILLKIYQKYPEERAVLPDIVQVCQNVLFA